mgnify:CR=1 FL=1
MSFSPYDLNIKDIFSGDNRYKIPNFQRSFSWENDNFDDFFEDLIKSSKINPTNNNDEDIKYFFGMILLLGNKLKPDVYSPYEVIDGQQRLTTMTLFFAAIQNIIKEKNENYATEIDDRLFCKVAKRGKFDNVQRVVNESLDPILPVSILNLNNKKDDGAEVKPTSGEQEWLLNAFEYIKKLLSKENLSLVLNKNIDDLEDDIYLEMLDELGIHLSNSIVIAIFHNNKEEANTLFRNLNNRGKPLSQSDLIKNELFSLLEDDSRYASKIWEQIEISIYVSGERLQKFIYHYMYGRFSSITNNNLFDKFMNYVDVNKKSYIEFLNSLKGASEFYKIILMPEDNSTVFDENNYFKKDNNPSIKRNLEFFKNIEISQCRILLITLFECRNKHTISNSLFKKFIDLIAKHQCLHVLVSSSPNKLTSVYARASKKLIATNDARECNIIFETLEKELKDRLPDINIVKEASLEYHGTNIKKMTTKERKEHVLIRFILQKLSEAKQDVSTNRANDGLGFIYNATLEHIIDKREKHENIFSIGNIILLERDVHNDVESPESKEEMYSRSKITMTKNFFNEYKGFDKTQILDRKRVLLETYYNLIID